MLLTNNNNYRSKTNESLFFSNNKIITNVVARNSSWWVPLTLTVLHHFSWSLPDFHEIKLQTSNLKPQTLFFFVPQTQHKKLFFFSFIFRKCVVGDCFYGWFSHWVCSLGRRRIVKKWMIMTNSIILLFFPLLLSLFIAEFPIWLQFSVTRLVQTPISVSKIRKSNFTLSVLLIR